MMAMPILRSNSQYVVSSKYGTDLIPSKMTACIEAHGAQKEK